LGSKNPVPLSDEERNLLAVHEASHAIVLMAVAKGRLEPMFLTTERYGKALGHLYPVEVYQRYLGATQEMLEAAICISLAGAAAEEVVAGEKHNSLGGDLPAVWRLLEIMDFNAMLGKFPIGTPQLEYGQITFKPTEEEDKAKRKRHAIEVLYERTKQIVKQNNDAFDTLVPALVEKKTLVGPDILELIGEKIVEWKQS